MMWARERRRALAEMGSSLSKDPASARFLRSWFRSLKPGHDPLHDALPWMSFKAIRWLDEYLAPTMAVFEYGAGGSTVFVAQRARRIVSVEHDTEWHRRVSRALRDGSFTNCDLQLVPPVRSPIVADAPYGPASYTSFAPWTRGYSFERYVRTIDGYPDRSFDLVIVDGYARPSAVSHAIPKVRRGGYLLLDDSDRDYTRPALPLLERRPRKDFVGIAPFQRNLQQTSVWKM